MPAYRSKVRRWIYEAIEAAWHPVLASADQLTKQSTALTLSNERRVRRGR